MQEDKKTYVQIWQEAFEHYKRHDPRPGYSDGFFTLRRHDFKMYPALEKFKGELSQQSTEIEREEIIQKWLDSGQLKNNNHSFRNYLVDELKKNNRYRKETEPSAKKGPIYYTGIVYRGCRLSPDVVFREGFNQKFISTSKNPKISKIYSERIWTNSIAGSLVPSSHGYIYKINLRSTKGIDQDATLGYQEEKLGKKEVLVHDTIVPEDIMGLVNEHGQLIQKNLFYRADPEVKERIGTSLAH